MEALRAEIEQFKASVWATQHPPTTKVFSWDSGEDGNAVMLARASNSQFQAGNIAAGLLARSQGASMSSF